MVTESPRSFSRSPRVRILISRQKDTFCSTTISAAASDSSGRTTDSFKYDPFGRRIEKSSSAATSVFAYDADNLIEETNSSGAVVARYSQTDNIDEPLAMLRSSATSYYNADGRVAQPLRLNFRVAVPSRFFEGAGILVYLLSD